MSVRSGAVYAIFATRRRQFGLAAPSAAAGAAGRGLPPVNRSITDLTASRALLSLSDSSSCVAPGFDLPFVVQGPWDDPLVFPDPESLIRRSPGAAPLLDAVRDRKTRDAVRSVIERFTGGGVRPAAPAPAAADGSAKPN